MDLIFSKYRERIWTELNGEGQRSLVSCSPWGLKESDMTERLNNNNNKTSKQSYHKSNRNVSDLIDKWPSKVIGYLRKNINTLSCWYFLLLFNPLVMSNSWQPYGLQDTRLLCPSPFNSVHIRSMYFENMRSICV